MSSRSPGSPAGQLVSRLRGADLCPSELKCYWPSTPFSPSGLRPFVPASLLFQISHWEAKAAARGHPRSWNLSSQTEHYTWPFLGIPPHHGGLAQPHAPCPASLPCSLWAPAEQPPPPPPLSNNVFLICPEQSPRSVFQPGANQLGPGSSVRTEEIGLQGTVCLPPCPCLFSSGIRAGLLSCLSLAPRLSLPTTWSASSGCGQLGALAPRCRESEFAGRFAGEARWLRLQGNSYRPVLARSPKMFCSCLAASVRRGWLWLLWEGSFFPPSLC